MNLFILLTFLTTEINLLSKNAEAIVLEGIVGGDEASERQFKYQISLQANGLHKCGGGIIADKFIITAAHCMVNVTDGRILNMNYTVVATRNVLYPNQSLVKAELEKIYIPKAFNMMAIYDKEEFYLKGDLAILKLKYGLGLRNNPLLSKLKMRELSFLNLRKTFVIAGHGVNSIKNKMQNATTNIEMQFETRDGILRYAYVEIVFNYVCDRLYNMHFRYYHLCARMKQVPDKPRGTCWGDSGSPLVNNNGALIGIFSFGPDTCIEDEYPGVYTRTLYFTRFINNTLKGKKSADVRVFTLKKSSLLEYQFLED